MARLYATDVITTYNTFLNPKPWAEHEKIIMYITRLKGASVYLCET